MQGTSPTIIDIDLGHLFQEISHFHSDLPIKVEDPLVNFLKKNKTIYSYEKRHYIGRI